MDGLFFMQMEELVNFFKDIHSHTQMNSKIKADFEQSENEADKTQNRRK